METRDAARKAVDAAHLGKPQSFIFALTQLSGFESGGRPSSVWKATKRPSGQLIRFKLLRDFNPVR